MSFDVQVAHGVAEIGQPEWDRLGEDQPFASYRWYRFGEAVHANDVPIYVTLYRADEPVARATFWLKRHESLPIPSRTVRFLLGRVLRHRPLLACRSPLSGTSGLILPAPTHREAALETILLYAQELVRKHRASFLLFDYLDPTQMDWPGWVCEGAEYVSRNSTGSHLARL